MNKKQLSDNDLNLLKEFIMTFLSTSGNGYALGVPKDMRVGVPDENGWCQWKATDSEITLQDIKNIEENLGFKFPLLFSEYLTYKSLLMTDFIVRLPQTPTDFPLLELNQYIEMYQNRFKNIGLFPFAFDGNDAGPVCFDLKSPTEDGTDYKIVIFDYSISIEDSNYRGDYAWRSFRDLVTDITEEMKSYI